MASPIYDTRNTVNEAVSRHTTVDPALKFGDVIPAANIVALEAFDPVKHAGDPLQLLVLLAGTDGIGLFAKIDIGVPTFATFFGGPGAQVVVELAKVTNSCCLNDASSPEAATLDVCATRRAHDRGRIVETASLLPVIVVAVFGRVGPGLVAFLGVIPETREGVFFLRSTKEGRWRAPPFGVGGRLDLHVGLHRAFHVGLAGRALVILVALAELTARVGHRIHAIDQIPGVFVAGVVLNGLLHRLGKKGSNIDEAVEMAVGGVLAHVKVLVRNAIIVHDANSIQHVLVAVDR